MTSEPGEHRTAPAVLCEDLVVRYGALVAVDGVSLRAGPGEVVAVLGPNGAGKTTTVETLTGYRRADAGRLSVLGLDPGRDHRSLVARVGVMLQRPGLYPMLSPRQAVHLFASYYPRPEDPEALLALVKLERAATTPWRHLSGGEQQRLSLALALVGRPEVVFLDEPTAGVDPEGRLAVRAVIEDLRRRGVCVVLTTHELGEAELVADRVIIVHRGRVMASGTPAELARSATGGEGGATVHFGAPAGLDTAALGAALSAPVAEERPGRYVIAAAGSPDLTATLARWLADHGAALTELRTGRTLEEAYLAVVGEAGEAEPAAVETAPAGRRGRGRRRGRGAA